MDTRSLQTHDNVLCLFSMSRFVVGDSKSYFQLELHQIKRLETVSSIVPKEVCLIASPLPISSNLEKYQKMLRFGVSLEAIKQKMLLDGLSTIDITHLMLRLVNANTLRASPKSPATLPSPSQVPVPAPLPPPPPPPLPPPFLPAMHSTRKSQLSMNPLINQPRETPPTIHKKPQPPSLSEILSMKGRLKKVQTGID
jgi:hypothetical protein